MIFQLHWQNVSDLNETIFVAQGDSDEIEDVLKVKTHDWIAEQIQRHRESLPEGWQPLVCWGDHPAMVLQAVQAEVEGNSP